MRLGLNMSDANGWLSKWSFLQCKRLVRKCIGEEICPGVARGWLKCIGEEICQGVASGWLKRHYIWATDNIYIPGIEM